MNNFTINKFPDNKNYKNETKLLQKSIKRHKHSFYKFNNITFNYTNKLCINYITFLCKKNTEINFNLININKKHTKIFLYDFINNSILYSIKSNNNNFIIENLPNDCYMILLFIENNNIFFKNNSENIQIINNSYNNLYLGKINNNINIIEIINKVNIKENITEINNKLLQNNETIYNIQEHSNILFNSIDDILSFYIDFNCIHNIILKHNFNHYKEYFDFFDLFSINYNIINNCNLILFTVNDWSNTAYRFVKSLKENKTRSLLIKINKHIFNYPYQGIIINNIIIKNKITKYPLTVFSNNNNFIITLLDQFKYIWFHASSILFNNNNNIIQSLENNHIYIVSHGGSTFRIKKNIVSDFFNNFCSKTIIQCPDLLKNLCNNESLIYYPLDTKMFIPQYNINQSKLIFSHYPSTKSVKGSDKIIKILNKFQNKIIIQTCSSNIKVKDTKNWVDNIKRYNNCDVYIETLMPILNGEDFGEWGNTCLEAAASGCIVITNCTHLDLYIKNYNNNPPILVSNTELDIEKNINYLLSLSPEQIIDLKKQHRKWVEEFHDLKHIGTRIKNHIF